jgi:cytochrome c oxidase cbb3-type subunit III
LNLRMLAVASLAIAALVPATSAHQEQEGQPPPAAGGGRGRQDVPTGPPRPNFPQQQRPTGDPALIARGKALYQGNCAACHGIDLRGGQQGGPNLLRSQTVLSDKNGELIGPIVQNGRPNPTNAAAPPMPPFPFPPDDIKALAEYIHSVLGEAGAQGRPPEGELVPPEKILVGDAAAGRAYFESRCASCHSATGDLRGIASRVSDPRALQDLWVSGGGGRGRGGRGRGAAPLENGAVAAVTVTPASGQPVKGRLVRIDDFTVTLIQDDGTRRTFARNGDNPKVDVSDPADAHRKLVTELADRDMHNVTAYLWTLK